MKSGSISAPSETEGTRSGEYESKEDVRHKLQHTVAGRLWNLPTNATFSTPNLSRTTFGAPQCRAARNNDLCQMLLARDRPMLLARMEFTSSRCQAPAQDNIWLFSTLPQNRSN